jgi:cbb3-type cytochrome oxidase subunit 3
MNNETIALIIFISYSVGTLWYLYRQENKIIKDLRKYLTEIKKDVNL